MTAQTIQTCFSFSRSNRAFRQACDPRSTPSPRYDLAMSGDVFIAHASIKTLLGEKHVLKAYNSGTGKVIWTKDVASSVAGKTQYNVVFDPSGDIAGLSIRGPETKTVLLSTSTGNELATLSDAATSLGLHADQPGGFYTTSPGNSARGLPLHANGTGLVVNLGIDEKDIGNPTFHRKGRYLLWSNIKGTITVADLHGIESQLRELDELEQRRSSRTGGSESFFREAKSSHRPSSSGAEMRSPF